MRYAKRFTIGILATTRFTPAKQKAWHQEYQALNFYPLLTTYIDNLRQLD